MPSVKRLNENISTVYDISLDGTFVDAFTGFVCHNTDGFNFELPDDSVYRYTKEHPYIGKGSNREVKLGKEYSGFAADVAEFNDLFMNKVYSEKGVQKMGLGIDEVIDASINFSRKNYADYFPEKPYPEDIKLVGNTVKSKKMPEYIAKFLAIGIRLLLKNKGQEFIEEYYKQVEKIYNFRIPLRDIATKGKIKKSVEQYKKDVTEITKAGRPKSRQAWYELAIKDNLHVDNGDTIYYINTGKAKSHADVKKIVHYMQYMPDGSKKEVTKDFEKGYKTWRKENNIKDNSPQVKDGYMRKFFPNTVTEDEIILNCKVVPREIIESDDELFCTEDIEYNSAKYLDMFNKRITPLLVCFKKEIRSEILVNNPKNRKFFTKEQTVLISGEPNKPGDQDTYEQLMTMEDKEIRFWKNNNLIPPFLEECGMGRWEDIVADYEARMQREKELGIDKEKEAFAKLVSEMTSEEIDSFCDDGVVPAPILKIVDIDPMSNNFVSKKFEGAVIGNIYDIIDLAYDTTIQEKVADD